MTTSFKGAARRLTDTELPRIGAIIGVGEDVLHAVMDVEAPKSGFDDQGRPRILFEPHVFYRELGPGAKRDEAVKQGLAYQNWKSGAYGKESEQYGKLERAVAIDRNAAIRSCSWGRGQIMGFNHALVGYVSASAMVDAFMASEASQVEAIVTFMASKRLDSHLRKIEALKRPSTPEDWKPVALGYNGAGYATHNYHGRLADRHNFWRTIPDTPWSPEPANTADAVPIEELPTKPAPTLTEELPTAPSIWPSLWAAILSLFKGK